MASVSTNTKPQLFVVIQQDKYLQNRDKNYLEKYRQICDHLCQWIEQEGEIDVYKRTANGPDAFGQTLSNIRKREIDPSRPYAFLFVAPRPGGDQLGTYHDTLANASDVTHGFGANKPVSSSVLLIEKLVSKVTKFTNNQELLGQIHRNNGDLSSLGQEALNELSKIATQGGWDKTVKARVETYAKKLSEHIKGQAPSPKAVQETPTGATSKRKAEPLDTLTINHAEFSDLKQRLEQIDWNLTHDAAKQANYPDTRLKQFKTLALIAQGLSFGQIAEQIGITAKSVKKNLVENFGKYERSLYMYMGRENIEPVKIAK